MSVQIVFTVTIRVEKRLSVSAMIFLQAPITIFLLIPKIMLPELSPL
jgi:hypothetical protein